jgi:hypothetical protein
MNLNSLSRKCQRCSGVQPRPARSPGELIQIAVCGRIRQTRLKLAVAVVFKAGNEIPKDDAQKSKPE